MGKKINVSVGDVFQILTSKGVCYGQVINTHAKYKYVIAVFREFFAAQPESFDLVVEKKPQFITTFLIQHAVDDKLFQVVGKAPVSKKLSVFPVFRGTNNLKGDNTVWWFWDGKQEWRVDRVLSDEEKKYPEGPTLPSAPSLVEMIEKDYRVERDFV